jgi:hypothetical protein
VPGARTKAALSAEADAMMAITFLPVFLIDDM